MRPLFRTICLVFCLAAAACDAGPTEPRVPTLDGTWSGSASGISLSIVVSQTDQEVAGVGTLFASTGSIPLTVDGAHAYPVVSLTLHSDNYDDSTFEGEFTGDDKVEGVINGSGFQDFELTLRRENAN